MSETAPNAASEASPEAIGALIERHGAELLRLALDSIRHGLDSGRALAVTGGDFAPELGRQRASFVTLRIKGRLRGCIGTARAYRPLAADVAVNAYGAAFEDPRFGPVREREFDRLDLDVAILTDPIPIAASSKANLIARLRPDIDGLILEDGASRGLFLPAVWESEPDASSFVTRLEQKAGLATNHWPATRAAFRFQTHKATLADLRA